MKIHECLSSLQVDSSPAILLIQVAHDDDSSFLHVQALALCQFQVSGFGMPQARLMLLQPMSTSFHFPINTRSARKPVPCMHLFWIVQKTQMHSCI